MDGVIALGKPGRRAEFPREPAAWDPGKDQYSSRRSSLLQTVWSGLDLAHGFPDVPSLRGPQITFAEINSALEGYKLKQR